MAHVVIDACHPGPFASRCPTALLGLFSPFPAHPNDFTIKPLSETRPPPILDSRLAKGTWVCTCVIPCLPSIPYGAQTRIPASRLPPPQKSPTPNLIPFNLSAPYSVSGTGRMQVIAAVCLSPKSRNASAGCRTLNMQVISDEHHVTSLTAPSALSSSSSSSSPSYTTLRCSKIILFLQRRFRRHAAHVLASHASHISNIRHDPSDKTCIKHPQIFLDPSARNSKRSRDARFRLLYPIIPRWVAQTLISCKTLRRWPDWTT